MYRFALSFICTFYSVASLAHSTHEMDASALLILAALEQSRVNITTEGSKRIITANGLPNHSTGSFPGRGNPYAISSQSYRYTISANPSLTGRATPMSHQPFGIALNGVVFDPATAECYGLTRGSRPSGPCDWSEEAILNGTGKLGLDSSNAHVQPTGAYHYHGIPNGLLKTLPSSALVHVGYAADGFRMVVSSKQPYRPSYQLRKGTRSSGPGGRYDGTYTQDFTYVPGSGQLDECNGTEIDGEYVYVLTHQFPFIPRCWKGSPDSSFGRQGSQSSGGGMHKRQHPSGRRPPHHHHRGI